MRSRRAPIVATALLLAATCASAARADLAKLNPTARVALESLTAGLAKRATTAAAPGELDVFVEGDASSAQLEAAGAHVRSIAPGICTARIPVAALEAVSNLAGVRRIDGASPVELLLDASVPTTGANLLRGAGPEFAGLNGAGVLIGDVDSGIDYHHDDFKDAAGHTRLVGLWDQTDSLGPAPATFGYGSEWSAADLDAGIAREQDLEGHGTHVMGIAAGDGSSEGGSTPPFTYVGMAPRASLAMVKTNLSDTGVFDGVAWVFARATALGMNAVCNLSLGTQYGPHDGSSPFESALSALCGPGRIVCVAAGNDRGISKHAQVFAKPSGATVTLFIQNAQGASRVIVAGYYDARDTIDVTLHSPSGSPSPIVSFTMQPGRRNAPYPGFFTDFGYVYVENGLTTYPGGMREIYIELNQARTTSINGTWSFQMTSRGLGPAQGRTDLWRFGNTAPALFFAGADPNEMLLTEPGNAANVITVGAWSTKIYWHDCQGLVEGFNPPFGAIGALANFSSPGPTRDGRFKPDLAAPGVEIASATSFDIPPVCSPATAWNLDDNMLHTINQGTSMAAPHVTGACALLLQKFGALDPAAVKAYLVSHAVVDANTGPAWNRDWGAGKLQLGDLVDPVARVVSPNGGEALTEGATANLAWNASDNVGVSSVDLELSRTGANGPFETLATDQPNTGAYAWTVTAPATSDAVLRVVAHDANANTATDVSDASFRIDAAAPAITAFALARIAPNPVGHDPLRVEYAVPRGADVRLLVYDLRGRRVATLAAGHHDPGRYTVAWDHAGGPRRVGAGLYFVRLVTPDGNRTARVIVTD